MPLMDDLLNLFQVDSQVRGLRSRLVSAERYLAGQQTKLDVVLQQSAELETRIRQLKAKIANTETEIAVFTERIDKLREELNSVETSKQYNAFLTEINILKAERSELETSVLGEMEQIEAGNTELEGLVTQVEERTSHRKIAKKQLEEKRAEVSERLAELEAERSVASELVPHEDLKIFEELSETYDGEAMSSIELINKRHREYSCTACNMHVPFETVSTLMGPCDSIVRCTVCRRILFLQEEARGALAKK